MIAIISKLIPPYVIEVNSFFWSDTLRGLAIAPFIFVVDKNNRSLVEHEKIHIRQQMKYLFVFFFIRWWYEKIKKGYRNISFEIEAFKHQDDWMNK